MNVFKINRGLEANLPVVLTNGCCYFCTDTTNFYIDYEDKNGVLTRSKLSSKYADTLRYTEDGNFVEINPTDIITKNNYETIISVASTDKNGLMSSADKIKLNNLPEDISASLANDFISAKGGAYSLDTTLHLSLNNIPTVISSLYDNPIFKISTDGLKYSESDTESYGFQSSFSPIAFVLNRSCSETKHPVTSCFSSNIWQMLDDVIDGDHRKFYLRSTSLQWRRYNGGWKNHYISAELDKLKIYNDQKLISFENSKLENIAAPTADNDAATKKYVDDKTPIEATTTNSGLMSAADKIKLNGIAQNANNYTLPVATADTLGGVKPTVKTDAMTKEVGIDVDGKLYVDDNTMIVNITGTTNTNGSTTYTADKTSQEIASAVVNDKKDVIAILYDTEAYLSLRCTSAKLTETTSESVFMVFNHTTKSRAIMKISNSGAEDAITVNIDKMAMAFPITSSTDDGGATTYSSGCTCSEILDALASGVLPICSTEDGILYVYSRANTASQYLQFTNVDAENTGFKYVNIYFDGTVEVGENIIPESVYLHQGTENAGKTLVVGDDGNVSVSDESAFVVNITNVNIAAKTAQSDKTYAEIKEAYEKGRTVYGVVTGNNNSAMIFPLTQFRTTSGVNVVDLMGEIGNGVELCFVVADDGKTNVFTYQYVNMRQGTENAGKILGIANDGIVTPIDKPTFTIDTTLTKSGQAADAKTVGDTFISNSANLMVEIDKKANSSDIPDISGKVDKLQGTDNAGKLLSVGNDGNVTTLSADNFLSSSGGEYTTNGVYKFIKASTGNYVNINSNDSSMGIYVADTSSAVGRQVGMTDYGFYIMSRDSQDGSMQLFKNKLTMFDESSAGTHEMNIGINDAHNTYISSYTKKLYFEESVLKNIGAPVDSTDAVTKKYVDEKFASATIKTWTAADMT